MKDLIGNLLFFQPFSNDMCWAVGIIAFFVFVFAAILAFVSTENDVEESEQKKALKHARKLVKTGFVLICLWVCLLFFSNTWDAYKLSVIHEVATSDTAEKTVSNINKFLDLLDEKLEQQLEPDKTK